MSLNESISRAEALCPQCAATPNLSPFQPIAVSAVEVCRAAAANLVGSHTARIHNLTAYTLSETERAINGIEMVPLPLSEDTVRILKRIEGKLDEIRRAIEQLPIRSKKGNIAKGYAFNRETSRLEKELKALVDAFLKITYKSQAAEGISSVELANFSIQAASAICEAPVLNFLKPVVGIAGMIAETAQTVKSNRAAAIALAAHSSMVTKSIAEHAATLGQDGCNDEAFMALKSLLLDIHLHLTDLQKPRRRHVRSWITANKERDRIVELNRGLDKALTLFTSTNVLSTHADVREIAALVRESGSVEEIATQVRMNTDQLTVIQADLTAVLVMVAKNEGKKKPNTALVSFSSAVAQLTFFFS
ncbi:hypothetical protein MSAN_00340700 [Mycena sanguinolenta]|uniref:Uncharacterized protein n=1 Tax=Mycena sanguinolenta TaxID=230812 RepID=A0A8H7DKG4_9AGAR|nr:hypothetical protein MSAN_00340700 [Mycena sanguinolenta]